jgi:acyl-CoA hydrolase
VWVSVRGRHAGGYIMAVMDAVAILIAVAFVALMLLLIEGIDRI